MRPSKGKKAGHFRFDENLWQETKSKKRLTRDAQKTKECFLMRTMQLIQPKKATQIAEPPVARFLFADTRMAWFWLIVRLYLCYEWLTAGLEKMFGRSFSFGSSFGQAAQGGSWITGSHVGAAVKGFASGALAQTGGAHPSVQGWYGWFLQHVVIPNAGTFAYAITFC